ncbi:NUDIX hydrolase [Draconibacterium sp.]|jgi:ADP-ribose pyrophosphatase YjhB (NUDIX family)
MHNFIFEKIKRIQALAEIGLHYSENIFDRERYEELQEIALQMLEQITDVPIEKITPVILEKDGYKTPKVDVRAVVFNEKNQILLVQEKVDGLWSLPGGWSDISFSPSEVAEKECFEEAGIKVKAVKLLAVLDKQKQNMPPAFEYVYKIFLLCEKLGDNISVGSETSDVGWFSENKLPEFSTPRNTEDQIKMMFQYHKGERVEPCFD